MAHDTTRTRLGPFDRGGNGSFAQARATLQSCRHDSDLTF
jgi:hypothetical protein